MIGPGDLKWSEIFEILAGGKGNSAAASYIVENRLNRSIVAIFAGGALALSGLILQVYFRNPLAGPGVLGITSGATLGVACILLGGISVGSAVGQLGIVMAGIIGSIGVLGLLLLLSRWIARPMTLLVVGLMFGFFVSAIISILYLWANQEETRQYVIWGLGSFEGLKTNQMWRFSGLIAAISLLSLFLVKPLNSLVLGTEYAQSLGTNLKRTKIWVIIVTGVLAALATVYCGPVAFIGIAVPQVIRMFNVSKNHAYIIPVTFIWGAVLAILSDVVVRLSDNALPLNAVTAIVGAPIIIVTIIRLNRGFGKI